MVAKGIYQVYFKANPSTSESIKFWYNSSRKREHPHKTGFVTFQPMSLNYRNDLEQIQQINIIQDVTGIAQNNTFTYPHAFGNGINLSYSYLPSALKENLVIEKNTTLPNPQPYIFDGGNPTLDIDFLISFSDSVEMEANNSLIEFKFEGETIFRLPTPYAYETRHNETRIIDFFNQTSGQNETRAIQKSVKDYKILGYQLKEQGNKYYIILKTPYEWLQDLQYPIIIDPSTETLRPNADGSYSQFPVINPPETAEALKYVNGRSDLGRNDWGKKGNSPYLDIQDEPANTINSTSRNEEDGDYQFEDISAILLDVYVDIYAKVEKNDNIAVYIWDVSMQDWFLAETFVSLTSSWAWHNGTSDIQSHLSDSQEFNNAKMYVKHLAQQSVDTVYLDCARLRVIYQNPTTHYDKVDEEIPDELTTYISTAYDDTDVYIDTFNKPNSSISENATINYIRVYRRAYSAPTEGHIYARGRAFIKSGANLTWGTYTPASFTWKNYYKQWNTNPWIGQPWTVGQIDALEIGVQAYSGYDAIFGTYTEYIVTQVWIEINYTLPIPVSNIPILFIGLVTFAFMVSIVLYLGYDGKRN